MDLMDEVFKFKLKCQMSYYSFLKKIYYFINKCFSADMQSGNVWIIICLLSMVRLVGM
jgi:uncharacterized membrane protein (GlpM family)